MASLEQKQNPGEAQVSLEILLVATCIKID